MKKYFSGVLLVLGITWIAMWISQISSPYVSLESLTVAIILGIIIGNIFVVPDTFKSGIRFSLKKLLKIGIVLLGFKLSIQGVAMLGPKVLGIVLIFVPAVLGLAALLGKVFKMNDKLSTLIGVGSCICGASAIVAVAPCIEAEEEDSIIAVSIISFLGAIGVLAYSAFVNSGIGITEVKYGVWSGLSLQGVAHAIAAAFAYGEASGEIGTFVKMTRVLMLVPVSVGLSYLTARKNSKSGEKGNSKRAEFPMYVLYFIMAGIINSLGIIPVPVTKALAKSSSIFIMMAMTAMGLSVRFKDIVGKGAKGMVMGSVLFAVISAASYFIVVILI